MGPGAVWGLGNARAALRGQRGVDAAVCGGGAMWGHSKILVAAFFQPTTNYLTLRKIQF